MDDLIGVLIFIGFIIISIISKFFQKSGDDNDGKTIEERLEEAIRRSKERAQAQGGSEPARRPVPAPRRPRPRTPEPIPSPPPPRPQPAARVDAGSSSRTYPPASAMETGSERPVPSPARNEETRRRMPVEARRAVEGGKFMKPRDVAALVAVGTHPARSPEVGLVPRHRRKIFTRRELRELIIFSELMKRPRILRNHPMYQRFD